jgi:hypothetical protein
MESEGERQGITTNYVRSLFHPLQPPKLVGNKESVILHADNRASPRNLQVHDIVPSGVSILVGSGTFWHAGSNGVAPETSFYSVHALLGQQDAEMFYGKFFEPTSGIQLPCSFRDMWEFIFRLPGFVDRVAPEVIDFVLGTIAHRPQEP